MATIFGLICDGKNCSADPNKSNEWVNFAKQKIISSSKPKQKPTRCHFKNCNYYFVTSTEKGLRLQIADCRRTLPLKSWPTLRFLQEIIHRVKIYKLCCLTSFSFLIETLLNQCPPVVLETICFKPLMAGHENIKKIQSLSTKNVPLHKPNWMDLCGSNEKIQIFDHSRWLHFPIFPKHVEK